jgi:hypothetical protein
MSILFGCQANDNQKIKPPLMSSTHDFYKQEIALFDKQIEKIKPSMDFDKEWNSFLKIYFTKKTDWVEKSNELQHRKLQMNWLKIQPYEIFDTQGGQAALQERANKLRSEELEWALKCDYELKREFLKQYK